MTAAVRTTMLTAAAPALVAESRVMREVMAAVDDVAPTPTTVLLTGESGTGKEVLARVLHARSTRARGPWVAVNCAALPATLLESELFGHERGAFTGAAERRAGRIEQANGGTLLLDEVSELPLALQAKLLRVLQEREVDRIGGTRPVPVDVRIIAASNRDLDAMVAQRQFRADLFYRLNVFPLHLPALRERAADILPLARELMHRAAERVGVRVPTLGDDAAEWLTRYRYPGNVRELANLMERAVVRSRGLTVTRAHLTGEFASPAVASPSDARADVGAWPLDLDALEKQAIAEALRRVNGNRTHAARLLGISLRTLRNKLRQARLGPVEMHPAELADGQPFSTAAEAL